MKLKEKQKAIKLRCSGYSLKEISEELNVSKGSVSLWVRDLELPFKSKKLLKQKYTKGQITSQKILKEKKKVRLGESKKRAEDVVKMAKLGKESGKIMCAMIYWCEGVKDDSIVGFTNSDPELVSKFLELFRGSFNLDEKKFRVCVHLHGYHKNDKQVDFWSKITKIPKSQFIKSYKKKNGGNRIRKNYQGCASIRYYNARLAQDLIAIAKEYMNKGPIG